MSIYDGPDWYSPKIGTFCGEGSIPTILSSGRDLYIEFVTDNSGREDGFKMKYEFFRPSLCKWWTCCHPHPLMWMLAIFWSNLLSSMRRRACPRLSFTSTIFSSKTSELLYSSVFFSLFSHSHQPRLLFVPFGVYKYDVLLIPIQTLLLFLRFHYPGRSALFVTSQKSSGAMCIN